MYSMGIEEDRTTQRKQMQPLCGVYYDELSTIALGLFGIRASSSLLVRIPCSATLSEL